MNDCAYWDAFYKRSELKESDCSDFCRFVLNFFKDNTDINRVMDAGCGNGRDGVVLAQRYGVVGMDNCGFVVADDGKFTFEDGDFVCAPKEDYDMIYSRFTLHSITNDDHQIFLSSIKPGTYLAIEARSTVGSTKQEHHGKTHYRNYINLDYLKTILTDHAYDVMFIDERDNLAIFCDENPVCVRVICKKV